ncbi:MAG TPA: RNA polymerase subunit sigma-70, partial [Anaerolineales bacterium]|nr:RNA polymerase subunit sigma-70 [Anaerolineales bacterium]
RRELQVHCYRILGSLFDAEDLVQETLLRAWRRLDTFEGRASFRAWLYKIATNACLDALERKRPRRWLPTASHPPADPSQPFAPPADLGWLEPLPDDLVAESDENPEARYGARESVTLAFLTALQALPPRQRAVVILCDVLDWKAGEAAECLAMTVSAVNSALHRARETLAGQYHGERRAAVKSATDSRTRDLLDRYVRAWETADVNALVALLREDAVFAMPPVPSWFKGRAAIRQALTATPFNGDPGGRWRLVLTWANGQPACAVYQRDDLAKDGVHRGMGVMVLTVAEAFIAESIFFMTPDLVQRFGLPTAL